MDTDKAQTKAGFHSANTGNVTLVFYWLITAMAMTFVLNLGAIQLGSFRREWREVSQKVTQWECCY